MTSIPDLIKKKRDGGALSDEEIKTFVHAVTNRTIEECQTGAMLMAIWQKGMVQEEVETLTRAMMSSGEVMSWPKEWAGLVVDKHSTGGVGDKVSLVLAPALAACGFKVPMISGRGLAHTGGTLDKLESIPGFKVHQSAAQWWFKCADCADPGDPALSGLLHCGSDGEAGSCRSSPVRSAGHDQHRGQPPTDRWLHRLKERSGVSERAGAGREVWTSGSLQRPAERQRTRTVISARGERAGRAYGGHPQQDGRHDWWLCGQQSGGDRVSGDAEGERTRRPDGAGHHSGLLLKMTGSVSDLSEGRRRISEAVIGGAALSKFQAMMEAQGVANETARSLCSAHTDYHSVLRKSEHQMELKTPADGFVVDVGGLTLAEVLHKLGAGRSKARGPVNHSVGAELLVSLGQRVRKGESWLRLHYEDPAPSPDQIHGLQSALTLGTRENTQTRTLVEEVLLPSDTV
ncbi:thymidine phosphorylase isoform 1-T1 [Lycodopsis pacificus]